jgi:putative oxidoreductase
MIIFIAVHSYVDVAFHGLEPKFVGAMFDQTPIALIFDQRLLWILVFSVLVIQGAGKLSLNYILNRLR